MNASASASAASGVSGGVRTCPLQRRTWFAIKFIDDKDGKIVEALTVKLTIPTLGDIERVTSTASDPIKIDELPPGGTGDVREVEHDSLVWEIAAGSPTT
jgi:hypothetical protein